MSLLFAFNHHNYVNIKYITQHHGKSANLSTSKPKAFSDLETFGLIASSNGNKVSTIPEDLVTEIAINKEVKVKGGLLKGGCSTSTDIEKDFILNTAWKVSVFGVILVRIFPHSDWIKYLSVFNPNAGKCGPEKL